MNFKLYKMHKNRAVYLWVLNEFYEIEKNEKINKKILEKYCIL